MFEIRITVVKTEFYPDLASEVDINLNPHFGMCPIFRVGDIFFLKSLDDIPQGFCSWAWADIQRDIAMILFGATPSPELKNPHSMFVCCDEGIRPVIFKIERMSID